MGGGGTSSDGPKGRLSPKGLPFSGFKYMKAVPDPEPEIRVGGPVIQSLRQGEGGGGVWPPRKIFFCPSVWSKNRGGGPLSPFRGSATGKGRES